MSRFRISRLCLQISEMQAFADGSDMKGIEKRVSEFVVARGNGLVNLEMADHALNAVAGGVETSVPTDYRRSVRPWRDYWTDAFGNQGVADHVAVIVFVGEEMVGPFVGQRHHAFERSTVRRFARCEVEGERDTAGITETMNLTGEPAPRAVKSLFVSLPVAPAAETWPLTVVESMLWRELSAIAWAMSWPPPPRHPLGSSVGNVGTRNDSSRCHPLNRDITFREIMNPE